MQNITKIKYLVKIKSAVLGGESGCSKVIDPIINANDSCPDCSMGHGDQLVLCDINHPAQTIARQTDLRPPDRCFRLRLERAHRRF